MSWARSALIIWSLECFFCPWTFNEPYELLRFLHFPARQIVSSCRLDSCLVLVQAPWTAGARFLIPCVRGFIMREYWMLRLSILNPSSQGQRLEDQSRQPSGCPVTLHPNVASCSSCIYEWFHVFYFDESFKGFQMSKWLEGLVVVAPTPSLKSRSVHRSEANIEDWKSFESLEYVWMIW